MGMLFNWVLAFLALSGLYLSSWPAATLFYAGIVLLPLLAGVVFLFVLLPWLRQQLGSSSRWYLLGGALLGIGAILGILLAFTGTLRPMQPWLYAHIAASVAGL